MNVSISEIMVVLLIALLVIRPEQMPDVAYTLGRFAQSIKRLFANVKDEMHGFLDEKTENAHERQREPK